MWEGEEISFTRNRYLQPETDLECRCRALWTTYEEGADNFAGDPNSSLSQLPPSLCTVWLPRHVFGNLPGALHS